MKILKGGGPLTHMHESNSVLAPKQTSSKHDFLGQGLVLCEG